MRVDDRVHLVLPPSLILFLVKTKTTHLSSDQFSLCSGDFHIPVLTEQPLSVYYINDTVGPNYWVINSKRGKICLAGTLSWCRCVCQAGEHVETPALSGEGDWGSDKQRAILVTMPPAVVMKGVWAAVRPNIQKYDGYLYCIGIVDYDIDVLQETHFSPKSNGMIQTRYINVLVGGQIL